MLPGLCNSSYLQSNCFLLQQWWCWWCFWGINNWVEHLNSYFLGKGEALISLLALFLYTHTPSQACLCMHVKLYMTMMTIIEAGAINTRPYFHIYIWNKKLLQGWWLMRKGNCGILRLALQLWDIFSLQLHLENLVGHINYLFVLIYNVMFNNRSI